MSLQDLPASTERRHPPGDVCPSTRLRCADPARCWRDHCGGNAAWQPITEGDLTRDELYHLRIAEQRSTQLAALQANPK